MLQVQIVEAVLDRKSNEIKKTSQNKAAAKGVLPVPIGPDFTLFLKTPQQQLP